MFGEVLSVKDKKGIELVAGATRSAREVQRWNSGRSRLYGVLDDVVFVT